MEPLLHVVSSNRFLIAAFSDHGEIVRLPSGASSASGRAQARSSCPVGEQRQQRKNRRFGGECDPRARGQGKTCSDTSYVFQPVQTCALTLRNSLTDRLCPRKEEDDRARSTRGKNP